MDNVKCVTSSIAIHNVLPCISEQALITSDGLLVVAAVVVFVDNTDDVDVVGVVVITVELLSLPVVTEDIVVGVFTGECLLVAGV